MRRVLLVLLSAAGIVFTSCKAEKDLTSGLEPMEVKLSLSQIGEHYVELKDANPAFSFNILKNYPIYTAKAALTVMSQEELGENFTPLAEGQYDIQRLTIDIADSEREHEVVVSFKDVTNLDPDLTYAVGLKLSSATASVGIDDSKSSIVVAIKLGPEGTIGHPYILSSADDLVKMKEKLVAYAKTPVYFKMNADIDLSGVDWTPLDSNGECPIDFDGGNHTIKNLTCTKGGGRSFFGFLWGRVANLQFENATIEAVNESAGVVAAGVGLVGWGRDHAGVLKNVHVLSGTVKHTAQENWVGWTGHAGGLCGEVVFPGSLVTECSANVDVTSNFLAGGLVGQANNATGVEKSFATGTVRCSASYAKTKPGDIHGGWLDPSLTGFSGKWGYAGGLIGLVYKTPVSNCYSTGEVLNTDPDRGVAGGLIGIAYIGADEVINCYSTSRVTARVNGGGIVGSSGFFDSGQNYIAGCVAWNPTLTTLSTDVNTGRVCGFMQGSKFGKISWGTECYARTDMVVTINGAIVTKSEQRELNTSGGPQIYEGLNTTNLVTTARDVLKWSGHIWDFSGERPVLSWEKTQK